MLKDRKGFSLIELIIVIVVVGVLAVVLITKFSLSPSSLMAARAKLINDIRYAQSLAVNRGGRYGVEFLPGSDTYDLYVGTPATKVADPQNPGQLFIVSYPLVKAFQGIDLASAVFDNTNRIEFDYRGVPYNGAGSLLVSDGVVVIQNTGGSYTIRVSAETGRVSYQ